MEFRGYTIVGDWIDSPNGKYAFAKKEGRDVFIKMLKQPTYPHESKSSPKVVEQMRAKCRAFEAYQYELTKELKTMHFSTSNLVMPFDFFREKASYYKVSDKIDVSCLSLADIAKLSMEQKEEILRSLMASIQTLHSRKIVHGDLKPDNILIQKRDGKMVARVIDFDDSYFEKKPFSPQSIVGTQNYYSPELATYVEMAADGETAEECDPTTITCKNDIFALGIIFHEYLTGEYPKTGKCKNPYVYNAVIMGELGLSTKLNDKYRDILSKMLTKDIADRPSALKVDMLIRSSTHSAASASKTSTGSGGDCAGSVSAPVKFEIRIKGSTGSDKASSGVISGADGVVIKPTAVSTSSISAKIPVVIKPPKNFK